MSYYRDPAGFLVAVPDGWTCEKVGTTLCFRDPAGIRVLSDPEGTTRLHAKTRWIASGGRGYAVGWLTREFERNTSRFYLDMIQASFQTR